jgi:hypothetical protein
MEDNNAEIIEEYDEPSYDPTEADDGWDDVKWGADDEVEDDKAEDSKDESEDADQHEADETEKQAETETEAGAEAEDADQWIELKHMDDEPRKVGKEEAKALAQKGLDYDRIRQERDDLKTKLPRYEAMEAFLKEMQGDFDSIEDFMDDTRARIKADAEGLSYDDALAKVKAAKPAAEQPVSGEDNINVDGFLRKFPDVKAEEIPASVWADVKVTNDLAASYEKYDNSRKQDRIAELEREIETLKNNQKNANRSTGSSKSSGASSGKSLIASMWDEDD